MRQCFRPPGILSAPPGSGGRSPRSGPGRGCTTCAARLTARRPCTTHRGLPWPSSALAARSGRPAPWCRRSAPAPHTPGVPGHVLPPLPPPHSGGPIPGRITRRRANLANSSSSGLGASGQPARTTHNTTRPGHGQRQPRPACLRGSAPPRWPVPSLSSQGEVRNGRNRHATRTSGPPASAATSAAPRQAHHAITDGLQSPALAAEMRRVRLACLNRGESTPARPVRQNGPLDLRTRQPGVPLDSSPRCATMTRRYAARPQIAVPQLHQLHRARQTVSGQMAVIGSIAVSGGRAVSRSAAPSTVSCGRVALLFAAIALPACRTGHAGGGGGEPAGRSPIKLPESGKVAAMTNKRASYRPGALHDT